MSNDDEISYNLDLSDSKCLHRKSDGNQSDISYFLSIDDYFLDTLWLQMITGYVSDFTNKGLIDCDFYFVQRDCRLNARRNIMRELIKYEDTSECSGWLGASQ